MLRPKSLTRCFKEAAVLSNISSTSRHTSWTKFNQENKHLFGDLLKEPSRRKTRILSEKVNSSHSHLNRSVEIDVPKRKRSFSLDAGVDHNLNQPRNEPVIFKDEPSVFTDLSKSINDIEPQNVGVKHLHSSSSVISNDFCRNPVLKNYRDKQLLITGINFEDASESKFASSCLVQTNKSSVISTRSVDSFFYKHSSDSFSNGLLLIGCKFHSDRSLCDIVRPSVRSFCTSRCDLKSYANRSSGVMTRSGIGKCMCENRQELKTDKMKGDLLKLLCSVKRNELYLNGTNHENLLCVGVARNCEIPIQNQRTYNKSLKKYIVVNKYGKSNNYLNIRSSLPKSNSMNTIVNRQPVIYNEVSNKPYSNDVGKSVMKSIKTDIAKTLLDRQKKVYLHGELKQVNYSKPFVNIDTVDKRPKVCDEYIKKSILRNCNYCKINFKNTVNDSKIKTSKVSYSMSRRNLNLKNISVISKNNATNCDKIKTYKQFHTTDFPYKKINEGKDLRVKYFDIFAKSRNDKVTVLNLRKSSFAYRNKLAKKVKCIQIKKKTTVNPSLVYNQFNQKFLNKNFIKSEENKPEFSDVHVYRSNKSIDRRIDANKPHGINQKNILNKKLNTSVNLLKTKAFSDILKKINKQKLQNKSCLVFNNKDKSHTETQTLPSIVVFEKAALEKAGDRYYKDHSQNFTNYQNQFTNKVCDFNDKANCQKKGTGNNFLVSNRNPPTSVCVLENIELCKDKKVTQFKNSFSNRNLPYKNHLWSRKKSFTFNHEKRNASLSGFKPPVVSYETVIDDSKSMMSLNRSEFACQVDRSDCQISSLSTEKSANTLSNEGKINIDNDPAGGIHVTKTGAVSLDVKRLSIKKDGIEPATSSVLLPNVNLGVDKFTNFIKDKCVVSNSEENKDLNKVNFLQSYMTDSCESSIRNYQFNKYNSPSEVHKIKSYNNTQTTAKTNILKGKRSIENYIKQGKKRDISIIPYKPKLKMKSKMIDSSMIYPYRNKSKSKEDKTLSKSSVQSTSKKAAFLSVEGKPACYKNVSKSSIKMLDKLIAMANNFIYYNEGILFKKDFGETEFYMAEDKRLNVELKTAPAQKDESIVKPKNEMKSKDCSLKSVEKNTSYLQYNENNIPDRSIKIGDGSNEKKSEQISKHIEKDYINESETEKDKKKSNKRVNTNKEVFSLCSLQKTASDTLGVDMKQVKNQNMSIFKDAYKKLECIRKDMILGEAAQLNSKGGKLFSMVPSSNSHSTLTDNVKSNESNSTNSLVSFKSESTKKSFQADSPFLVKEPAGSARIDYRFVFKNRNSDVSFNNDSSNKIVNVDSVNSNDESVNSLSVADTILDSFVTKRDVCALKQVICDEKASSDKIDFTTFEGKKMLKNYDKGPICNKRVSKTDHQTTGEQLLVGMASLMQKSIIKESKTDSEVALLQHLRADSGQGETSLIVEDKNKAVFTGISSKIDWPKADGSPDFAKSGSASNLSQNNVIEIVKHSTDRENIKDSATSAVARKEKSSMSVGTGTGILSRPQMTVVVNITSQKKAIESDSCAAITLTDTDRSNVKDETKLAEDILKNELVEPSNDRPLKENEKFLHSEICNVKQRDGNFVLNVKQKSDKDKIVNFQVLDTKTDEVSFTSDNQFNFCAENVKLNPAAGEINVETIKKDKQHADGLTLGRPSHAENVKLNPTAGEINVETFKKDKQHADGLTLDWPSQSLNVEISNRNSCVSNTIKDKTLKYNHFKYRSTKDIPKSLSLSSSAVNAKKSTEYELPNSSREDITTLIVESKNVLLKESNDSGAHLKKSNDKKKVLTLNSDKSISLSSSNDNRFEHLKEISDSSLKTYDEEIVDNNASSVLSNKANSVPVEGVGSHSVINNDKLNEKKTLRKDSSSVEHYHVKNKYDKTSYRGVCDEKAKDIFNRDYKAEQIKSRKSNKSYQQMLVDCTGPSQILGPFSFYDKTLNDITDTSNKKDNLKLFNKSFKVDSSLSRKDSFNFSSLHLRNTKITAARRILDAMLDKMIKRGEQDTPQLNRTDQQVCVSTDKNLNDRISINNSPEIENDKGSLQLKKDVITTYHPEEASCDSKCIDGTESLYSKSGKTVIDSFNLEDFKEGVDDKHMIKDEKAIPGSDSHPDRCKLKVPFNSMSSDKANVNSLHSNKDMRSVGKNLDYNQNWHTLVKDSFNFENDKGKVGGLYMSKNAAEGEVKQARMSNNLKNVDNLDSNQNGHMISNDSVNFQNDNEKVCSLYSNKKAFATDIKQDKSCDMKNVDDFHSYSNRHKSQINHFHNFLSDKEKSDSLYSSKNRTTKGIKEETSHYVNTDKVQTPHENSVVKCFTPYQVDSLDVKNTSSDMTENAPERFVSQLKICHDLSETFPNSKSKPHYTNSLDKLKLNLNIPQQNDPSIENKSGSESRNCTLKKSVTPKIDIETPAHHLIYGYKSSDHICIHLTPDDVVSRKESEHESVYKPRRIKEHVLESNSKNKISEKEINSYHGIKQNLSAAESVTKVSNSMAITALQKDMDCNKASYKTSLNEEHSDDEKTNLKLSNPIKKQCSSAKFSYYTVSRENGMWKYIRAKNLWTHSNNTDGSSNSSENLTLAVDKFKPEILTEKNQIVQKSSHSIQSDANNTVYDVKGNKICDPEKLSQYVDLSDEKPFIINQIGLLHKQEKSEQFDHGNIPGVKTLHDQNKFNTSVYDRVIVNRNKQIKTVCESEVTNKYTFENTIFCNKERTKLLDELQKLKNYVYENKVHSKNKKDTKCYENETSSVAENSDRADESAISIISNKKPAVLSEQKPMDKIMVEPDKTDSHLYETAISCKGPVGEDETKKGLKKHGSCKSENYLKETKPGMMSDSEISNEYTHENKKRMPLVTESKKNNKLIHESVNLDNKDLTANFNELKNMQLHDHESHKTLSKEQAGILSVSKKKCVCESFDSDCKNNINELQTFVQQVKKMDPIEDVSCKKSSIIRKDEMNNLDELSRQIDKSDQMGNRNLANFLPSDLTTNSGMKKKNVLSHIGFYSGVIEKCQSLNDYAEETVSVKDQSDVCTTEKRHERLLYPIKGLCQINSVDSLQKETTKAVSDCSINKMKQMEEKISEDFLDSKKVEDKYEALVKRNLLDFVRSAGKNVPNSKALESWSNRLIGFLKSDRSCLESEIDSDISNKIEPSNHLRGAMEKFVVKHCENAKQTWINFKKLAFFPQWNVTDSDQYTNVDKIDLVMKELGPEVDKKGFGIIDYCIGMKISSDHLIKQLVEERPNIYLSKEALDDNGSKQVGVQGQMKVLHEHQSVSMVNNNANDFQDKCASKSEEEDRLLKLNFGTISVTLDTGKSTDPDKLPKSFKITVSKGTCLDDIPLDSITDKMKKLIKCPKGRGPCYEFTSSIIKPKKIVGNNRVSECFVESRDTKSFNFCPSSIDSKLVYGTTSRTDEKRDHSRIPQTLVNDSYKPSVSVPSLASNESKCNACSNTFTHSNSCMKLKSKVPVVLCPSRIPTSVSRVKDDKYSNDKTNILQAAKNEKVSKELSNVASLSLDDVGLHEKYSNKSNTIKLYCSGMSGHETNRSQSTVLDQSHNITEKCNENMEKVPSNVSMFSRLMPFLNSEQMAFVDKIEKFPLLNKVKSNITYQLPENGIINMNYTKIFSGNELKNIPSVTKILNATMSEKARVALEKWKNQMIKQHGEEGFELLNKAKLQQGSDFHNFLSQYLLGSSLDVFDSAPENVNKLLESLKLVLKNVTNVSVIESHVIHSRLPYRGIIDCVAKYNGRPAVIEWKHSDKKKRYLQWTYDAPIQMSAYLGALNYDDNYRLPVKAGMVIVAYTDGSPADVFWLSQDLCQRYWKIWLSRLHQYLLLRINL